MNYVNVFLLTFYSFLLSVSLLSQNIHEIDIHLDNPDSLKQSAINLGQFTQFASVLDLDLGNSLDEPSLNLTVNLTNAYGAAIEYTIHDIESLENFKVISESVEYDLIDWSNNIGERHTISQFVMDTEFRIYASTYGDKPLNEVISIHRSFPVFRVFEDFMDGVLADCDVDVVCEISRDFVEVSRGITKIYVVHEEGVGFCSGTLMNNTQEDFTPYILSGFHCMDGFTPRYDMWQFEFNFLKKSCGEDSLNGENFFLQSCSQVSGWRDSDFLLLKLNDAIPPIYKMNYFGWNAAESLPDSAFMLHHPRGNPMKISLDKDPITIITSKITWNTGVVTPASHHLKLEYDIGSQEGGSSGAPALNYDNQVIGQLNGGKSNCVDPAGYYGRMSKSWEGGGSPQTRLKDWLDPIAGNRIDFSTKIFIPEYRRTIFSIRDGAGRAVPNARITINSTPNINLVTENDGLAKTDELLKSTSYTYSVGKMSADFYEGLSGKDVTSVTRIIQGIDTPVLPYQSKIGDINRDGVIDILDRIALIEVVLKLKSLSGQLWYFFPEDTTISPSSESIQTEIIKAYKLGDFNFSADPKK